MSNTQTVNVQIQNIEWQQSKKPGGRSWPLYILSENSVSEKASNFDPVSGADIGAWGDAVLEPVSKEGKDGKLRTYFNLVSFRVTMPAGEKPATAPLGTQFTDGQKIEQALGDAKGREIAMENANTASAMIVAAILPKIAEVDAEVHALAIWNQLAAAAYERTLLAKQDRIATKANPYAGDN